MTKFAYYLNLLAITAIPFSTSLSGGAWTLLIIPGVYFFILHVKQNKINFFLKRKSQLFLLLFIFAIIFSNLMNLNVHSEPVRGFKKIRYLIICFFNLYTLDYLVKTIGSKNKAKLLANIIIYGFTFGTIYAYVSYIAKYDFIKNVPEDLGGRVTGITGIMNYGYETPIIVFFCLAVGFYFRKKEKIGLGLVNAFGVIFSGTRGGILSLIGGLPFLIFYHFKRFFKAFILLGVSVVVLIIIAVISMDVDLGKLPGKRNLSDMVRLKAAELSLVAFTDSPIYGHGLLNQKNQYPVTVFFKGKHVTPYGGLQICENTYLQVLVDMGSIGILLYLAFLFYWVKELFQRKDVMTYLLLPSVFAFIISSLVHTMFITGTTTAVLISYLYNFSVIDDDETKRLIEI